MNLHSLIERNYNATVKRGLITDKTTLFDFIAKLKEEIAELEYSIDIDENSFDGIEAIDIFLVAGSMLKKLSILDKIEGKVIINENRLD